ncbi:hypothetical protein SAY87_003449 [Trapa incisa]|uniref:CASP-like protein n=1 Tax=Trapa incisa TaxID=236973 RepID=A0AAN7KP94_9MYRT|nr:hypothetical protein SAY87_003449 [Trapa incisa]
MAHENGMKPDDQVEPVLVSEPREWLLLTLRVIAFLATASATLVMALNKETKKLVVATIGSTPITATLTAKFQHSPAFVFFVIANANASFHNLLMIGVELGGRKFDHKGLRLLFVAVLDMLTVVLASSGDGAATFMADLGKRGNSHARWNKICDKFDHYCSQGGGALIASYVGLGLLTIISILSTMRLVRLKPLGYQRAPVP